MMNGKFKAGDIVFFHSDGSFQDLFIRLVSPKFTHMGIFINETEFVEASARGVRISKYSDEFNADVYRIVKITDKQITSGIKLAFDHLGEKYSFFQAIVAGILRLLGLLEYAEQIDSNWFCSEFVAYIVRKGFGIEICPNLTEQNILPDDLAKSPLLYIIHSSKKR